MSSSVHTLSRPILFATVRLDKASMAVLRGVTDVLTNFELAVEFPWYANEDVSTRLPDVLRQRRPDICIIDFDQDRESAALTAEQIREAAPGTALIALASDPHPDRIIAAMRSGCSEYLLKPIARDHVLDALTKIEKKRGHVPASKGRVYTFLGVKGGSGVTTLATHLATFIAKRARTLLIDHHPDVGDVSVYCKLPPHQFHFYELVNNTHRMDAELLQGFVVRHSSGVDVLTAPDSFGSNLTQASPSSLQSTLNFLQEIYDVILVDAAPGLGALNVSAIDLSEAVYLVLTPELPSVRNLIRYLDHLKRFNCPEDKLRVILNRHAKKSSLSQQQIEKAIRTSIALLVPNCYADIISAITVGEPISTESRSEFAAVLRRWAASLTSEESAQTKVEPKRRFAILGL